MAFSHQSRLKAEAIFAGRKDKEGFVSYEFVDYKGQDVCTTSQSFCIHMTWFSGTAHGFACRPNLAYEDLKAAFEGSLAQTVEWFRKTLAE
jgi:carboxymethylenebutenolidase